MSVAKMNSTMPDADDSRAILIIEREKAMILRMIERLC